MNRLLKAAAALVCAFGLQLAAPAQMTNITAAANSLSIGGSVISTGTVTIVPVNVNGIPIPIKKSGGGLVGPGPMHCSITSGVLGSCPVPDSSLTTPPNILYTITLKDTSTGNETSGLSFVEQAIAGISGATWGLDQYAPPAATTAYQGIAAAHGPSVPTSCSAPSYFTLDTSSTLEQCVGGVYVPVTGSSPLPATATTMGVVQLPNGQTSTQLSKVAVTGQTADLVGTLPHSLLPPLVSADIPSNAANTTGNAATATALAGTPGQCPAGQAPTGILSNGTATGCAPASGGGASTPATSALLKGNGNANGVSAATAGTDYPTVASVTSAASSASAAQTTANTAVTNAAAAQATANTAVTNAATANSAAAAAQTAANTAVTNAATAASAASAAQATANTASTSATAAQTAATSASTNASSAQTAASAASTAATAATVAAANAVQKTGDAMTGPLLLQSTATLQGTGPAEVGFGHASGPTILIPGNAVTLMAPVTPPSGGAGIRLPVPDNTSGPLCMPALANDPENSAFQSSVLAHCTAGTDYATPASVTAVQVAAQAASLQKANNLSDLASAATARTNLGLGSAATTSSGAYDAAGAAAAAQTAAQAASDPLGTAQALVANIQTTSTAVTANNMLYPDPANVGRFTTAALGKCGTGPAASSVASGASVQIYDNVKTWTLIADGPVTYGDFLIPGTTAGHVQDASVLTGVTPNDRTTISLEQDVCGKALATIASAGTLAVEPLGRGTRGLKVDVVAPSALTPLALETGLYGSQALSQPANILADYQLLPSECSGTTASAPIDYSGNGNTGTLATGINLPTCNAQGLVLNGAAGTAPNSGQYFYTAGTQNSKTIMLVYSDPVPPFVLSGTPISPKFPALFGNAAHAGHQFASPTYGYIPEMLYNGAVAGSYQTNFEGTHVLVFVLGTNPPADAVYLDGVQQPTNGSGYSYGHSTGVYLVGGGGIDYAAETFFTGNVYRATFWSTALSASEVVKTSALARKAAIDKGVLFDVPPNTKTAPQLIADGNSLTAGPNVTPWPSFISTRITYTVTNLGIGSIQGAVTNSMVPYREKVIYAPSASSNVATNWELTNDIALNGYSSQAAVDHVLGWCYQMKALGIKSIVASMISRGAPAVYDTQKNSVNTLLRAQWANACDALADVAANANVGADGAYSNTTYFQGDMTHLQQTTGQQNIVAPIMSHAIDQVTGSSVTNCDPAVVTATTYTSIASDGCKVFNTASNAITDTLPSAIGYTGRVIRRCNNSASGSNALTIAAPSDYPFNNVSGTTTVTIPNNTCKDFAGTLVSASAGGDYWRQLN